MKNNLKYLQERLLCPVAGKPLQLVDGRLFSPDNQITYFETEGIPWVYCHPQQQLFQWRQKIKSVIDYYQNQALRADAELRKVDLLNCTKNRLELLKGAYLDCAKEISHLMTDVLENNAAPHVVESLFYEKVPRQQSAMAYHQTLFRDWAWGKKEIEIQAEAIIDFFKNTKNLLVLGAGSCGLPYYLHQNLKIENTLAVDINPLLLLPAQKLISGEKITLTEFPTVPALLKDVAVKQSLSSDKYTQGFHFLFADAQSVDFKPDSFDTILTPWFIDIVPRDFRELARQINHSICKDGTWVNIGQLGFEKNTLAEIYTPEEIREILEESGFRVEIAKNIQIPYLHSPHSRVGRQDQIFVFSARKEKSCKKPARFEYLPEWLRDWKLPIPLSPEIQQFQFKSHIFAQTSSMVNGQTSIDQIAQIYATKLNLDVKAARESLYSFFLNVYEQLIFREF